MRAVFAAGVIGMMIWVAGLAPAKALPAAPKLSTATLVAAPLLSPIRHHGHHWRWSYRHGGWWRYAPYGPVPEIDANGALAEGSEPPASPLQPQAAAPVQNIPAAGSRAAGSRPSIEWVNPSRGTR